MGDNMKKSIAAITLAGAIALTGAGSAIADNYTAPVQNGTVSDGTVAPGEAVIFSGTGFEPGEIIDVTVEEIGTPQALGASFSGGASMAVPTKINLPFGIVGTFETTANADGSFSLPITLNATGTYKLTAVGRTSGHTVSSTVTVAEAAVTGAGTTSGTGTDASSANNLADTGADASLVLWSLVGAGALAAGAASVVVVRRRAKAEAAA